MIKETDLIINPDGSIYHLGLTPDQICENIILVGDQDRVSLFESHFDRIYFHQQRREFHSLMGEIEGKNILVISTGIGTDNIDIVINEIDALANIDFRTRKVKSKIKKINFVRLGTSGTIQGDINVDSLLASKYAIGFDSLMHFYNYHPKPILLPLVSETQKALKKRNINSNCYAASSDDKLIKRLDKKILQGITVTLPGFYGPQTRMVRSEVKSKEFIEHIASITLDKYRITNFEMETSGIYGLCNLLGHRCLSISAIIANRASGKFSKNPQKTINNLVEYGIEFMIKVT